MKTGYSFVLINDELVYTLMVQNTGRFRVDNVTLLDVLPTGLPFVDASPPPDDVTLPLLTWSLGSMEPRERRTVVITTTAPAYEGVILHYDGKSWKSMSRVSSDWLSSIWGSVSSGVFAVGSGGTILHKVIIE